MIIENKIDNRSFGPFGSSAGLFLFIGGLVISYYSLIGLLIAIAGAFAAFTSTCTIIDTEKMRIRHADYIFGLLPTGKWIDIKPGMKLGLRKSSKGYVGYSRGAQPMEIRQADIRIILFDNGLKQIMPVKKFPTYEAAENELKQLSLLLGLQVL